MADLLLVLGGYGQAQCCDGGAGAAEGAVAMAECNGLDLDGDCAVGVNDLLVALGAYGGTC